MNMLFVLEIVEIAAVDKKPPYIFSTELIETFKILSLTTRAEFCESQLTSNSP